MSDTSTVQTNSTSVSASSKASSTPPAPEMSRGQLLQKILAQHSFGLLLMRIVIGCTMIAYGVPKFLGGKSYLESVGYAMHHIGVDFGFAFWGLMAALVEIVGGLMLMMGSFYRVSCALLTGVMIMATLSQKAGLPADYSASDFILAVLHPLSMAGLFLSMMFIGPGRLSMQQDD